MKRRKEYKNLKENLKKEGHVKVSNKKIRDRLHRDGYIINLTASGGGYDVYTQAGYAALLKK